MKPASFFKHIIILLLITSIQGTTYSQEIIKGAKVDRVIFPKDVTRVVCALNVISGSTQKYGGYIAFYDANDNPCAVQDGGPFYLWSSDKAISNNHTSLEKRSASYYKEIYVMTSKFKVLKLRDGRQIVGIFLPPFSVKFKSVSNMAGHPDASPRFTFSWAPRGAKRKWTRSFRPGSYA